MGDKLGLQKVNADIHAAIEGMMETSPEIAELFSNGSPKFNFPGGLRYRQWRLYAGRREYMYCYSTTRNKNGKFLSWVYKPSYELRRVGDKYKKTTVWSYVRTAETRRRKSAKNRAYRMYTSHKNRLEKSAAERTKSDNKGSAGNNGGVADGSGKSI